MKWTLQDPGEWFEESSPSLLISAERIEAQTAVGENIRGKIKIETTNGRKVRGTISVSEARIVPELEKFSGMTLTLVYGIDVIGLMDGDTVDGSILLSTNLGEYTIPVHVEIREAHVKSSAGEIRDLAAFADLARENYEEAFRLFTGPSFVGLLEGGVPGWLRSEAACQFYRGKDRAGFYPSSGDKAGCYKTSPQYLGKPQDRCGGRCRFY